MGTSTVPATLTAILATLQATGATVYDGPVVTDDVQDAIWIGYDGDPGGTFESIINHLQSWAGLGKRARNETFSIVCAVTVLLGNDDTASARAKAYTMLGTVETSLRADPSLAQPPPFVAEIEPNSLLTEPTSDGFQVRIPFFIHITIARV